MPRQSAGQRRRCYRPDTKIYRCPHSGNADSYRRQKNCADALWPRTSEDLLMHEAAVAQSIFDTVMAETKKQNGKPIRAKITCGTFDSVNEEILAFAFSAIARGTIANDMKIEVEQKPVTAKCHRCKSEFIFDIAAPNCGYCGSDSFDILPDPTLILEQIIFE